MPAAAEGRAGVRRPRRGGGNSPDCARQPRASWHRLSVHRLHFAGKLSGTKATKWWRYGRYRDQSATLDEDRLMSTADRRSNAATGEQGLGRALSHATKRVSPIKIDCNRSHRSGRSDWEHHCQLVTRI